MLRSTTLLFLAAALIPSSFAQGQAGLDAYNQDLDNIWPTLRPGLESRLEQELRDTLLNTSEPGTIEVTVRQISSVDVDLPNAPGFDPNTHDRGHRVFWTKWPAVTVAVVSGQVARASRVLRSRLKVP